MVVHKKRKKIEYKSNVIVIGPTSSPRMKIIWLVTLHAHFLPYCEGMTDSGTPFFGARFRAVKQLLDWNSKTLVSTNTPLWENHLYVWRFS